MSEEYLSDSKTERRKNLVFANQIKAKHLVTYRMLRTSDLDLSSINFALAVVPNEDHFAIILTN